MRELAPVSALENFRDPKLSQVFWVTDRKVAESILDMYTNGDRPYAIEVGCGAHPLRGHAIDPGVDWLHVDDSEEDGIAVAKEYLSGISSNAIQTDTFPPGSNMILLNTLATPASMHKARIVAFRNPAPSMFDPCTYGIVPYRSDLMPGQRILVILDEGYYKREIEDHIYRLWEHGYPDPQFTYVRHPDFSYESLSQYHQYRNVSVFDFTRPPNS